MSFIKEILLSREEEVNKIKEFQEIMNKGDQYIEENIIMIKELFSDISMLTKHVPGVATTASKKEYNDFILFMDSLKSIERDFYKKEIEKLLNIKLSIPKTKENGYIRDTLKVFIPTSDNGLTEIFAINNTKKVLYLKDISTIKKELETKESSLIFHKKRLSEEIEKLKKQKNTLIKLKQDLKIDEERLEKNILINKANIRSNIKLTKYQINKIKEDIYYIENVVLKNIEKSIEEISNNIDFLKNYKKFYHENSLKIKTYFQDYEVRVSKDYLYYK